MPTALCKAIIAGVAGALVVVPAYLLALTVLYGPVVLLPKAWRLDGQHEVRLVLAWLLYGAIVAAVFAAAFAVVWGLSRLLRVDVRAPVFISAAIAGAFVVHWTANPPYTFLQPASHYVACAWGIELPPHRECRSSIGYGS